MAEATSEISEEYAAAIEAHRVAYDVYVPIRTAYRAGSIADAEYLAARAVYFAAVDAYSVAADAEANR